MINNISAMKNPNGQIKISAETRRSIFDKIMSHADFLGVFQGGNYEDQNNWCTYFWR